MAAMMAAPLMISRLDDRPIVESVRICILASGVWRLALPLARNCLSVMTRSIFTRTAWASPATSRARGPTRHSWGMVTAASLPC